jgi:hypothetical protein
MKKIIEKINEENKGIKLLEEIKEIDGKFGNKHDCKLIKNVVKTVTGIKFLGKLYNWDHIWIDGGEYYGIYVYFDNYHGYITKNELEKIIPNQNNNVKIKNMNKAKNILSVLFVFVLSFLSVSLNSNISSNADSNNYINAVSTDVTFRTPVGSDDIGVKYITYNYQVATGNQVKRDDKDITIQNKPANVDCMFVSVIAPTITIACTGKTNVSTSFTIDPINIINTVSKEVIASSDSVVVHLVNTDQENKENEAKAKEKAKELKQEKAIKITKKSTSVILVNKELKNKRVKVSLGKKSYYVKFSKTGKATIKKSVLKNLKKANKIKKGKTKTIKILLDNTLLKSFKFKFKF